MAALLLPVVLSSTLTTQAGGRLEVDQAEVTENLLDVCFVLITKGFVTPMRTSLCTRKKTIELPTVASGCKVLLGGPI
jgi:hypothetical protein